MAMTYERRDELVKSLRYYAGGYKRDVEIRDDIAREIADELERINHAVVRARGAPKVTIPRQLAEAIVAQLKGDDGEKVRAELLRLMGAP